MTESTKFEVQVASKTLDADVIAVYDLVSVDGGELPAFDAGAHIDVHVPGDFIRQYSLCNNPSETHRYQIGVLRDLNSRGGSIAMHEHVNVGDTITISTPRNHFMLVPEATHSILIAGGIGVTPILSMAETLGAGGSFEFHYCTRSYDVTAFRSRLTDVGYADKIQYHYGDAVRFKPEVALATPEAGIHVYVCGPIGFMESMLDVAREKGWPDEQLHYEFFNAEIDNESNEGFEVEIKSSGLVVNVPEDMTVVAALAEHGIKIEMSCEQGVCGTCLTKVLDGVPEHKDLYLMPKEHAANDQFMPCCSRSLSPRLVLDL